MLAKLLGLGARVDRPTSIGVANAGEPVLLTDTQLDMAAGGDASASAQGFGVIAAGSISLSSTPTAAAAGVNISFFNNIGPPTPIGNFLAVTAQASTPAP